ncbi:SPOR domain-containing protein [Vallicoccus soli]|uniref:SPOR domain-containing protein n=1 Tax=Vallicoccus soli TaxID=2339232 RepID=A0A3A3YYY3_9ACTN|nr:SPOR domain-containing protein [Vallicoccus soli]RJK96961.1 SPOR domain-containing protein [Vallicoccus soli]
MAQGPFFFNVRTGQVEGPEGARAQDRMGPYATREEAERALESARERTERWDREDRRWEEGDDD